MIGTLYLGETERESRRPVVRGCSFPGCASRFAHDNERRFPDLCGEHAALAAGEVVPDSGSERAADYEDRRRHRAERIRHGRFPDIGFGDWSDFASSEL